MVATALPTASTIPNLPANTTTNIPTRCFAENYIVANPQLSAATYTANLGKSNYHSMQAQITARPIQGITIQTTYTLSKLLGLVNGTFSYTDPSEPGRGLHLSLSERHA